MLWLLLTLLALVAGFVALRRKRGHELVEDEPWRASLEEEDEVLDLEEIRRAEDEWRRGEDWQDLPEDEPWS